MRVRRPASSDVECAVKRPYIPALALCAGSMWASDAALLLALEHASHQACMVVAGVCVGALLLLLSAWARSGKRMRIACVAGLLLGAMAAGVGAAVMHEGQCELAGIDQGTTAIVRSIGDVRTGGFASTCSVELFAQSGKRPVRVQARLPDESDLSCWDVCLVHLEPVDAGEAVLASCWKRGQAGIVRILSVNRIEDARLFGIIQGARTRAISAYDGISSDGAALMRAVACGDKQAIAASESYGSLKAVGLAHMVAVSGAHLAIVASFAARLLSALRLPRVGRIVAQLVFVAVFVVFAGAPASAIRAAVMAACALLSFTSHRRPHGASALGICAMMLLALDPFQALSVSLTLSALATAGIIVFAEYLSSWCFCALGGRWRLACDAAGMSIAACMLSLPVTVPLFGCIPLVSPLANILMTPVLSLLCIGGLASAVASLVDVALAALIAKALAAVGDAVCAGAQALAALPCASVAAYGSVVGLGLAIGVAALVVYCLWPTPTPQRARAAAAACALLAFLAFAVAPSLRGVEVVMLDVGQGDAIVLRDGAHAVLVDTGTNDSQLLKGLARHGVVSIEAVIITHADDDHCGSLQALLDTVDVGRVCVAADALSCPCKRCTQLRSVIGARAVCPLHQGDVLRWGSFCASVIWPRAFIDEGGNDDSVVLAVSCDVAGGPYTMLLTGDAEHEVLDPLAGQHAFGTLDVLKVGHHGSDGSVSPALLEAAKPQVCLISVGAHNRYGHPTQSTMGLLRQQGCTVYRSDQSGDVVCSFTSSGMRVKTLH